MEVRIALLVVAGLATSAHAGPFAEVGIGYLDPHGGENPTGKKYDDIVDGGLHLSLNAGWLFPVLRDGTTTVSVGPVAAAELTLYGADDPNAVDGIDRWRFLGGARVAVGGPRWQLSLQGLAGVDRPTYDWAGVLDAFCGDTDTTSGFGWEVGAGGQAAVGPAVFGISAAVLHADHAGDQPTCTGTIVVDVVDYESWDLVVQATGGVRF